MKWRVTVYDIKEMVFQVEAEDWAAAMRMGDDIANEDGGISGDYYEVAVRKLPPNAAIGRVQ
jgi:hypothetical protein